MLSSDEEGQISGAEAGVKTGAGTSAGEVMERGRVMPKAFTLFLGTSPYGTENTLTAVRLADSALRKGHEVNLIASGDAVYCFLKAQKAKGVPNAGEEFAGLIQRGLKVYL